MTTATPHSESGFPRRSRLGHIAALARSVSSALDLETVLREVTSAIIGLRPGAACLIRLVDRSVGGYRLAAVAGMTDEGRPRVVPFGEGLTHVVAESRRPLLVLDVAEDPRVMGHEWFSSRSLTVYYGVPLEVDGELLGVLNVVVAGAEPTEDECEMIETLAGQAAVAIRNARLFAESEARRREAEELAELARTLTETLQFEVVGQRVADAIRNLLDARSSVLLTIDPVSRNLVTIATAGAVSRDEQVGTVHRAGTGAAGLAAAERRPVVSPDILADPRITLAPADRRREASGGDRSLLALPLVSQAQVIGVLAVRGQTGRLYDDRDVTLAQVFAHQASLALENARLYQEAQRSYRELARAQAGLVRSETLRATGELAAGAAHHLNNLLTIVLGNIQLVMAHGLPPDVARRMSVAEAAAIRAGHVVHRLALFARSYPESRFVALDLNAIAADALRLTRPEWTRDEARGARLHVSLEAGDVALVAGDPTALRDVVVNLILNAVEALVAGGTVTVRTWTAGDRVALAVSDTGPGMTPDVQRRAFEPFFTTKGPGATGLGLSVTLGIVQRHGGELTIDSTPEQGTTVTAWLPTRSAAEAPPTSA